MLFKVRNNSSRLWINQEVLTEVTGPFPPQSYLIVFLQAEEASLYRPGSFLRVFFYSNVDTSRSAPFTNSNYYYLLIVQLLLFRISQSLCSLCSHRKFRLMNVCWFFLCSLQFVKFANIEEDTPSYHRRYDFFVSQFSAMCHSTHEDQETRTRYSPNSDISNRPSNDKYTIFIFQGFFILKNLNKLILINLIIINFLSIKLHKMLD